MKLTKKTLIKLIKEEINEMADYRRPGNAPPGTFVKPERQAIRSDEEGVYVDNPETQARSKQAIANLLGGDEQMAAAIMAAVRLAIRGEEVEND